MSISFHCCFLIKHWMKLRLDCQHNNIDNKKKRKCSGCAWARESIPYLKNSYSESRAEYAAALFFWFVGWCCCLVPRLYVCLNTFAFIVLLYLYPPSTEKAEKDVKIILHSPSLVYVCFRLEIPFFLSFFYSFFQLLTFIVHHSGDSRANQAPSHQTIIKLTEGSFGDICECRGGKLRRLSPIWWASLGWRSCLSPKINHINEFQIIFRTDVDSEQQQLLELFFYILSPRLNIYFFLSLFLFTSIFYYCTIGWWRLRQNSDRPLINLLWLGTIRSGTVAYATRLMYKIPAKSDFLFGSD